MKRESKITHLLTIPDFNVNLLNKVIDIIYEDILNDTIIDMFEYYLNFLPHPYTVETISLIRQGKISLIDTKKLKALYSLFNSFKYVEIIPIIINYINKRANRDIALNIHTYIKKIDSNTEIYRNAFRKRMGLKKIIYNVLEHIPGEDVLLHSYYTDLKLKEGKIGKAVLKREVLRNSKRFDTGIGYPSIPLLYGGSYWALYVDGDELMSDLPMEHFTHYNNLKEVNGRILIAGMGIGLFFSYIKNFEQIDIIEKEQDVINLIYPNYNKIKNVNIFNKDFKKYKTNKEYDYLYVDTNDHNYIDTKNEVIYLNSIKKRFPNVENIILWGI